MSQKKTYTAADLLVKCLENEGVQYVFGLPGEENADLMIALEKSKTIKFILVRHEQGAAFMGDVWGRLTGQPAICLGTLGPGATNLVTGVADANMDRAPLIVLTGQGSTERIHKESHQVMDVVGLFKPITKWNSPIRSVRNIPEIVRKAFKIAQSEKPGATHIEFSENIAGLEIKPDQYSPIPAIRVRRPVPDDKIIDQAWGMIKKAKYPIILAGNGCIRKRAHKQLKIFTKATGIGVINTFMAKGSIGRNEEQCLFTIGLQSKDYNNCAIDESDLVICLGYDLVEYHPHLWNKGKDKNIIHIDFLEAEVDEHYTVKCEIVGDLAHSLWMLNERNAKDKYVVSKEVQHKMYKIRQQFLNDFAEYKDDDTKDIIKPQKVLWDIRQVLGPHDILLSDVGAHKMWIARYYQCDEPNTCLISNGFCSMGFALPGAIGAKLAFPERKVVAICGDGGFLMNCQEMETAKRIGTNIIVIVWEDGGYGLISWKQDNQFGYHTNLSFQNPDLVKLAESFGWIGYRVNHSKDFRPTLEKAVKADSPVLITLPIDYRENPKLTKKLGMIQCSI